MTAMDVDFFNAADFLVHRRVREGIGGKVALIGSRTRTYEQLSDDVARLAGGLRALGLQPGDRVAMVMSDDVELAATILAAFHAGLIAVPMSTMLTSGELGQIIQDSGARMVVATEEHVDTVLSGIESGGVVGHLVIAGDQVPPATVRADLRVHRWADLFGDPQTPAVTDDDSSALWLYTSGTTGKPKAAMHRHANIRHVYDTYGRRTLGVRREDRCLSVAKMFFAYGIGNSLFFPLAAGGTTILQPLRPTPDSMCERLTATAPSLFFAVPTFYSSLAQSALPDDAFESVRLCVSAGEVLPVAVHSQFKDRFGVDILDGIGSTEALHIFLSNRPDDIRPGTTGKPVFGYQIEVRNGEGSAVTPGVPGDLYVCGESIAAGYWQRPEANQAVFQGGWLRTGDTYVVDESGYYHCLGRSNDLLKAGGIWVSPTEVEGRLLAHPAVAEAAVVGAPGGDGIEKPVALVVRSPGHEVGAGELIDWCRADLAAFKAPRVVEFVTELPKTATGKLQRYRVREMLAEIMAPRVAQ
ncbi:benzoate-CoA ligase family protein [Mycolicibacterium pulveris]|uniref:Benzoate--CoA ligase n=1 Tax=Mycolicibacterium pulveris TaxID=36813 RepID=A0A7I7USY5_MYCPV|nr:benzoate-CoA ligase family protein [Mycolicibacterium pulveris]MCV6983291.1 benzoate-CoA ligase family protein [Mycolicibacterium pulveris]BBY83166.1 benzoate--CoA ligase [Mycolicibacterium pulveris]